MEYGKLLELVMSKTSRNEADANEMLAKLFFSLLTDKQIKMVSDTVEKVYN